MEENYDDNFGLDFNNVYSEVDESIFGGDSGVDAEDIGIEEEQDDDGFENEEPDDEEQDDDSQNNNEEQEDEEPDDEEEDNEPIEDNGDNLYSSIATSFVKDGFFDELADDFDIDVSDLKTAEDFYDLFEEVVNAKVEKRVDEKVRRVNEALDANVPVDQIKGYENALNTLDNITKEALLENSQRGETLRRNVLNQYYFEITKNKARAEKMASNAINSGNDKDESLTSLEELKNMYRSQYDTIIKNNKKKEEDSINERRERADKMRKDILESSFGDMNLSKQTRQKIYDNITAPSVRVNGNYMTELQAYQANNPEEFLKNVGMLFTLTDGFKNFDRLAENKAKKEVTRRVRSLENAINNHREFATGLQHMNGTSNGNDFGGWKLSI